MLSACKWSVKTETIPVYMEIPVVHPEPYTGFILNTPMIEAVDKITLRAKLENMRETDVYYILDGYGMRNLLDDEVSKLEYMQHESSRANYYKTYITDYNARIKEMNK